MNRAGIVLLLLISSWVSLWASIWNSALAGTLSEKASLSEQELNSKELSLAESLEYSDWAVTLYSTVLTEDPLEHVITGRAAYDKDFQLVGFAATKRLPAESDRYDLEWEIQVVKHVRGQNHMEVNGLYSVRWYPLPWDGLVESNLALGLGISYASKEPEFEQEHHKIANRYLAYILLEAEFQPQRWGNWSLVIRSHHRSGAFGLFNDVEGASNSLGVGIKYRFR